jgi:hypothetical protein
MANNRGPARPDGLARLPLVVEDGGEWVDVGTIEVRLSVAAIQLEQHDTGTSRAVAVLGAD